MGSWKEGECRVGEVPSGAGVEGTRWGSLRGGRGSYERVGSAGDVEVLEAGAGGGGWGGEDVEVLEN